jgi:hypothetical protein
MAVILKKEMLQLNSKSNDLCSLCKCTCFAFRHSPGLGDGSNSTQKKTTYFSCIWKLVLALIGCSDMLRAVRVTDYMMEEASVTVLTRFSLLSNPAIAQERKV